MTGDAEERLEAGRPPGGHHDTVTEGTRHRPWAPGEGGLGKVLEVFRWESQGTWRLAGRRPKGESEGKDARGFWVRGWCPMMPWFPCQQNEKNNGVVR